MKPHTRSTWTLQTDAGYKTVGKIGEGTFSEVLKTLSLKDGNYYACKKMKQLFKSTEQVNNLREIQALRRLSPHPNILILHEVVFERKSGCLALICELMDMNIYELIRGRRQPLAEDKVRNYMYQLCKSLEHIHKNGIFHRDVKPENILIKQDLLKLGDFGSCRSVFSKQPYTEYISTRWYRAPECLLTDGYYSYKMDIWSAGCVLFEISRSRAMNFEFPSKKGTGLMKQLPSVSPECLSLLSAMVEYDPDQRISASEALQHAYFSESRALERQSLHHKLLLIEKANTANSMNYLLRIAGQSRRQQALKSLPEPIIRHHGPTFPVELPKLNVSGVSKTVSYPMLKFQSVFPTPANNGKLPIVPHFKYFDAKVIFIQYLFFDRGYSIAAYRHKCVSINLFLYIYIYICHGTCSYEILVICQQFEKEPHEKARLKPYQLPSIERK
uniref:MOK protein kinase n=1 Tax=Leptobrachium leishanense TaxID=445787 RepID=A0A8C5PWW7_9ANUR